METKLNGETLKKRRIAVGVSQWQVASTVGRTQGWLSNIELGYVTPKDNDVRKITAAIRSLEKQKANPEMGNSGEFH